MRTLSNRLNVEFIRLDGVKAYAFLSSGRLSTSSADKNPYRVLVVRHPSPFHVGDVVKGPDDTWLLLLEHPAEEFTGRIYRVAFISETHPWKRPVAAVDPISRMAMSTGGLQDMGTLYCNFESPTERDLSGLKLQEYKFLTGQDVQVGDQVGGKTVKSVYKLFGVNLIHAE